MKTNGFDVERIRADFPVLERMVNGHPLAYMDNGASAQMPRAVIETGTEYRSRYHANIHRGVHTLSQEATEAYEATRELVRAFIGAADQREVVFTGGTTDSLNLVAQCWGNTHLKPGDVVLVSEMEHHANIVPWDLVCRRTGARMVKIPITDSGEVDQDAYAMLLAADSVKAVCITHVSNALGTVNPVRHMADLAHAHGAVVVVDGAQAVPHAAVDVQALDADFYAFSAHKMCGPTGIGVLYGKMEHLKGLPPYRGGGDMILSVSFDSGIRYNAIPHYFEAGTPPIEQGIQLGAAIRYLTAIGMDRIAAYEQELLAYATEKLLAIPQVRLVGTAPHKAAVISFVIDGVHPHDVGTVLDDLGIAVRTGHHCAQPVMERFGVPATTRASFAFYNTRAEIDRLADGVREVIRLFQ